MTIRVFKRIRELLTKRSLPAALLVFGLQVNAHSMPPHPSLALPPGGIPKNYSLSTFTRKETQKGSASSAASTAQVYCDAAGNPLSGNKMPVLAIPVRFSGGVAPIMPLTSFDTLLIATETSPLRKYYRDVSKFGNGADDQLLDLVPGKTSINTPILPSTLGWITVPNSYDFYLNDGNINTGDAAGNDMGMGAWPRNSQKLLYDVLSIVAPMTNIDLSKFDCNLDGEIDAVILIHTGTGAEFVTENSFRVENMWSHHNWAYDLGALTPTFDGVYAGGYAVAPEFWRATRTGSQYAMTVGVFAHEFGHLLGLPELYDEDGTSYGVGKWSVMGTGSWNGPSSRGESPAYLDAWSRIQVGFAVPQRILGNLAAQQIDIAPFFSQLGQILRLDVTYSESGNEYFLVEHRKSEGFDASLPGQGLLVWHVDDSKSNNTEEGNTAANHYKLKLIQADGAWNLESKTNAGDGNDPFPGGANKTSFTVSTSPNSLGYSQNDFGIALTGISVQGSGAIRATVDSRATFVPQDFSTIQGAINASPDGNQVYVGPGTYNEHLSVVNKSLIIKSLSGASSTIVDGNPKPEDWIDCPYVQRDYQSSNGPCQPLLKLINSDGTFDGFTLRNNTGGGGVFCSNSTDPTVRNSIIKDNWKISYRGIAEMVYPGYGAGVALENCGGTIENNIIKDNMSIAPITNLSAGRGGGISVVSDFPTFIRSNLIAGNVSAISGGGMYLSGAALLVFNNTVARNSYNSVWLDLESSDIARVTNTIMTGNAGPNLLITPPGKETQPTIARSIIGDASGNWSTDPSHPLYHLRLTNIYPTGGEATIFKDASHGDFSLPDFSPGIDAGDGSVAPSLDMSGNTRFDDGRVANLGSGSPNYTDIGTYERQGCSGGSCPSNSQSSGSLYTCFLAGTKIKLADGSSRPIESIDVGQEVTAFDEKTQSFTTGRVSKLFRNTTKKYLVVNETLKVTPRHPVYSEGKWVEIGNLKIGDKLLGADGKQLVITSIKEVKAKAKIFNFEVEKFHTYVAGGIVVHNMSQRYGASATTAADGQQ